MSTIDEGIRLLESGDVTGAVRLLESVEDGENGRRDAVLGLALFRAERYRDAAERYDAAIAAS